MSKIDVTHAHSLGLDGARAAADKLADKLKDMIKASFEWDGDHLRFKRSGAEGFLRVAEDELQLYVNLGMLLRPMKGMIEEKISSYLEKELK